MDIPLFQAALSHTTDGYAAQWIVGGNIELFQADDLMTVLQFLQGKIWADS